MTASPTTSTRIRAPRRLADEPVSTAVAPAETLHSTRSAHRARLPPTRCPAAQALPIVQRRASPSSTAAARSASL